jgi:ACS family D-galactonate transporter-like MFS transporter
MLDLACATIVVDTIHGACSLKLGIDWPRRFRTRARTRRERTRAAGRDGLIHATPDRDAGISGSSAFLDFVDLWVAEGRIFSTRRTELLRARGQLGCRTLDGAGNGRVSGGGGVSIVHRAAGRRLEDAGRLRIIRRVFRAGSLSARVRILALISLAVAINYLDRAVLGIAAPSIQQQFALNPAVMGVVFSAFSWTYFLGQVPSGVLLDRFGTRAIYSLSLLAWSLATLLHAAATGFASLLGLRLALGLAEAPCFPANSNVVAKWFPRSERGRAIGVYTAAEYVGLSFMSPVLFWILNSLGCRALFGAAGGIGVAAAFVFARQYRDPADHPSVSRSELAYVAAGGMGQDGAGPFRVEPGSRCSASPDVGALHPAIAVSRRSSSSMVPSWPPGGTDWIRVGIFLALPNIADSSASVRGMVLSFHAGQRKDVERPRKLPVMWAQWDVQSARELRRNDWVVAKWCLFPNLVQLDGI